MSWFKKLSQEKYVNPSDMKISESSHIGCKAMAYNSSVEVNNTTTSADFLSKSISSLSSQLIEVVDPENFFHDPEHVRNYKEEEKFLQIMSEWEIIDHPGLIEGAPSGNFFSADFEDELIHLKIHEHCSSVRKDKDSHTSCELPQMNYEKKKHRRSLCEILFRESIKTGIVIPPKEISHEHSATMLCPKLSNDNKKDNVIDRRCLKTEAFTRSVVGGIEKCPEKKFTNELAPISNLSSLSNISNCDNYDIKHFFRLDDYGNILLNMNHIKEFKGYGFTITQNHRLYLKYLHSGCVINETYSKRRGLLELLKCLLRLVWYLLAGKN